MTTRTSRKDRRVGQSVTGLIPVPALARLYGVKLLVLNWHEAWVHQLGVLGAELDIVTGLSGRSRKEWDSRVRPIPAQTRTLELDDALHGSARYDCVISHSIADLLDTRAVDAAKLLVLHDTLEGWMRQQRAGGEAREMRATLNTYLASVGGHAIAISRTKAKSWGVTHTVVHDSADPDAYLPHVGDLACGIRLANHISAKRPLLAWDFHTAALDGLPLRIVGENPDMPGVRPADDWEHLKRMLSAHRFLVHTADPRYEDGYNMGVLEGMAAGLPVVTNAHPTTLVLHGVTGFVASTPEEMRGYANQLLQDEALAHRMGEQARAYVARNFAPERFKVDFGRALQEAQKKWHRRAGLRHTMP
jgi:hypothetical protein